MPSSRSVQGPGAPGSCSTALTPRLNLPDAKQLDELVSAFPELASGVLFLWRESQSAPVSLQSQKLRPEPLSRLFPNWLHSLCCIILCNLIPFPGRNNRPGLTCSQGMNMHVSNRTQCSFRAKSHLRRVTLLLWKSPGAGSPSPQTSVWPLIPVMFSSSRGSIEGERSSRELNLCPLFPYEKV